MPSGAPKGSLPDGRFDVPTPGTPFDADAARSLTMTTCEP